MSDTKLPAVPATKDDLLIAALRHANCVSVLLNDLAAEALKGAGSKRRPRNVCDTFNTMLIRRFSDCSGLHLFIAADALRLDLPDDLKEIEAHG